jgi:hypothetical protein
MVAKGSIVWDCLFLDLPAYQAPPKERQPLQHFWSLHWWHAMKVRENANGSDGYEDEVHGILVILVLDFVPEPRVSEGANYSKTIEFDASLII